MAIQEVAMESTNDLYQVIKHLNMKLSSYGIVIMNGKSLIVVDHLGTWGKRILPNWRETIGLAMWLYALRVIKRDAKHREGL